VPAEFSLRAAPGAARAFRVRAAIAGMVALAPACAIAAAPYPDKPVRILANPAGGAPDFTARIIAQSLSPRMGQQFVVDNRPAAIAIEAAAKAVADGHTILITGSALWLTPYMRNSVAWDPLRDFAPVTVASTSPTLLVVPAAMPVNSVADLITLSKGRPGRLNYSSTATGTIAHIAAEQFKSMAGVDITRVPYKGAAPALVALVAGEVDMAFATTSSVMPHIRAGRLKALAISSAAPSALAPGLPTVAATLPGYEAVSIIGVFAPSKTPATVIAILNREVAAALNRPDIREKFVATGAEVVGSTPAQLTETVKQEMSRIGKMIRDAGIREE